MICELCNVFPGSKNKPKLFYFPPFPQQIQHLLHSNGLLVQTDQLSESWNVCNDQITRCQHVHYHYSLLQNYTLLRSTLYHYHQLFGSLGNNQRLQWFCCIHRRFVVISGSATSIFRRLITTWPCGDVWPSGYSLWVFILLSNRLFSSVFVIPVPPKIFQRLPSARNAILVI